MRLNYALFALVLVHAIFYGALSRTASPFTHLLALIVIAVFLGAGRGGLAVAAEDRPGGEIDVRSPLGPPLSGLG